MNSYKLKIEDGNSSFLLDFYREADLRATELFGYPREDSSIEVDTNSNSLLFYESYPLYKEISSRNFEDFSLELLTNRFNLIKRLIKRENEWYKRLNQKKDFQNIQESALNYCALIFDWLIPLNYIEWALEQYYTTAESRSYAKSAILIPEDGFNIHFNYQITLNNLIIDIKAGKTSFEKGFLEKVVPLLIKDIDDVYDESRIKEAEKSIMCRKINCQNLVDENTALFRKMEESRKRRKLEILHLMVLSRKNSCRDTDLVSRVLKFTGIALKYNERKHLVKRKLIYAKQRQ